MTTKEVINKINSNFSINPILLKRFIADSDKNNLLEVEGTPNIRHSF